MNLSRSNLLTNYNFTGGLKLARGDHFWQPKSVGGDRFWRGDKIYATPLYAYTYIGHHTCMGQHFIPYIPNYISNMSIFCHFTSLPASTRDQVSK